MIDVGHGKLSIETINVASANDPPAGWNPGDNQRPAQRKAIRALWEAIAMGAGWGGQVDGGKGQELRYCIARSGSRLGYTIGFLERTVARVLVFLAVTTL